MNGKRIILYAGIKFWQMSEGMHVTIAHQFEIFKDWDIYFVFFGKLSSREKEIVLNKYGAKEVFCINDPVVTLVRAIRKVLALFHLNIFYALQKPFRIRKKYKKKMDAFIRKNNIRAVLVNYIWQSDLFIYEGNDYYKIIETHDPQYLFCSQNRKVNPKWPSYVTREDEVRILSQFDLVLAVSNTDADYFKRLLKNDVFYLPFTVDAKYIPPKSKNTGLIIGFVGGKTEFNYRAAKWFIDNVLIRLDKDKFSLYIYGNVCKFFGSEQPGNFVLKGFADTVEEIYETCDIMVNPALISGGIKTKNVECISHGLPLLTTTSGSKGMEEGVASGALFSSDEPKEWVDYINSLTNPKTRDSVSKKAYDYAQKYFSSEKDKEFEAKVFQYIDKR